MKKISRIVTEDTIKAKNIIQVLYIAPESNGSIVVIYAINIFIRYSFHRYSMWCKINLILVVYRNNILFVCQLNEQTRDYAFNVHLKTVN